MKEENQNSYTIQSDEAIGQVQIADEVVAIIARPTATEGGRRCQHWLEILRTSWSASLEWKKLSKGNQGQRGQWRSEGRGERINIDYGCSVPKTSRFRKK